ncbi:hypothetical protein [Pseudofrankia inefficax]|nr:hypothetical protein [Pseudofrankia inefficax]
MSIEERNAFGNLILLCTPHHKVVDKTSPDEYPVQLLRSWKAQREAAGQTALAGLRQVTEARLEEMILDVLHQRDRELNAAIARFEEVDSQAAAVLRDLLRQLEEANLASSALNQDSVTTLDRAARKLQSSVNLDVVTMLDRAARKLEKLPSVVDQLTSAAWDLQNKLPDR